ncbi:sodium-coupled monocarboxylate transporter 2-like isoform X3 [Thrips palmi]|uniref:Sodium-coupled monocarboxylate transporter 2-like isoform X3 n=1 Tax=Thrips palmi TaxID=161013 RepID=A0A6P8YJL5_THRPL|nr:sodium-coupled monocarboxylate transporter 2-like isoform X3 [Thrips palmi]
MVALGSVIATAVLCVTFLPVLHALKLGSTYEYLELRFDTRLRKLTSVMYTIRLLLLLPLVIYVPALAFTQVTGISIHVVAPAISALCVLYTTAGGLRAVALTGSLQLMVMLAATVALLAAGIHDVGGFGVVWRRMEASGRVEFFNMDPNPLTRTTFWSATLGGTFFWLQMLAVQPNSVQRYLAVPTLAAARRTAGLQCGGLVLTTTLACFLGAVVFAKYDGCDPLVTKEVQRPDQLVALMVEQTSSRVPGLAGLFLAGLFSAAMGNLSAALNTLSGTLYADLVSGWLPAAWRAKSGVVIKALGVVIGVWATLLVFVVERIGGLVQVAMSLGSVTSGTMLGLFTLGMLVPRANALGALAGAGVSVLGTALVVFGQQSAIAAGMLKWPAKPTSADQCGGPPGLLAEPAPAEVFFVLRLSYLWLVLLGTALTVLVGTVVSLLTARQPGQPGHRDVDPALLFQWRRPGPRARQQQHELNPMVAEKT